MFAFLQTIAREPGTLCKRVVDVGRVAQRARFGTPEIPSYLQYQNDSKEDFGPTLDILST